MSFEIAIGANIRKSPYFDATVDDGVRSFSVYNHMYMPGHFGDPMAEYDRLLNGVVMWDVAGERQVQLSGPDAGRLAQYLTPRDLRNTKVGQGRYVPLCDAQGRVLNDPVLLKLSDTRYWLSVADSDVQLWAAGIAQGRGWDVEVSEPDVSPLAVQGPLAAQVIAALFGDWVHDLRYFWFRETELDGIPLVLARSGWSKQGGYELYLQDAAQGRALWDKVKKAGQPWGIGPGAPNDIERIESGLLSYGADFRLQTRPATPFELGLGKLVSLDGHDFVGRAALQRLSLTPPTRRWTGFFILADAPVAQSHPVQVLCQDQPVGYLSEMVLSPRLTRWIGVGMIQTDLPPDAALSVTLPSGQHAVQTTALPFI